MFVLFACDKHTIKILIAIRKQVEVGPTKAIPPARRWAYPPPNQDTNLAEHLSHPRQVQAIQLKLPFDS